jgi:hypothetical protein
MAGKPICAITVRQTANRHPALTKNYSGEVADRPNVIAVGSEHEWPQVVGHVV